MTDSKDNDFQGLRQKTKDKVADKVQNHFMKYENCTDNDFQVTVDYTIDEVLGVVREKLQSRLNDVQKEKEETWDWLMEASSVEDNTDQIQEDLDNLKILTEEERVLKSLLVLFGEDKKQEEKS